MGSNKLARSRYAFKTSGNEGNSELPEVSSNAELLTTSTIQTHIDDGSMGYVHSYEIGSTMDGPGIRFVLFLTGCKLRCQYCHNPDTWDIRNGKPYAFDKMMKKINSYTEVLKISKGGLTISGGEPGFQHAFVKKIFKAAKKLGLHTCLDTSGFLGANFSDEDLMDIDLHLLDIKSGDPEVYKLVTKQPIQPTLELAERLSRLNRPVWVRFVLVPGLTDSWENVEKVADICANIQSLERVEILRFHQLGKSKWEQLGINYTLAETETPTLELVERVRSQFKARNLTVY
ncbi:pyruvate formate-lyase-activating protein [Mongoliitalea lutea]|uniref:Pyruvate formate-lyase-activating enzyme n=1 Tax=Mongoliitalea lutea TaxID=849756 RepID=A0A8J3CY04_9BACT|nr:pyruvate formate-lyase-activating protein [Mongoliitalea lutea]GHB36631.1 pyruvate formate-lyase-activating enzyme [Mongoliitalea lutea]